MSDAIKKLIEGGKWQPIKAAPKNGTRIIIGDGICHWQKIIVNNQELGGEWVTEMTGYPYKPLQYNPESFMLMPTDRLANALEIAVEALERIRGYQTYDAFADRTSLSVEAQEAEEALQKIQAIAEGKCDTQ